MEHDQERRIPETVFTPAWLRENPRRLNETITRAELIDTFNEVFSRFQVVGNILERRYQEGGFGVLVEVAQALQEGRPLSFPQQQLADDYKTYLDYRDLFFGRGNVNAADYVIGLDLLEEGGQVLTDEQGLNRQSYRNGLFREIPGIDRRLSLEVATARFIIPTHDVTNDESFATPLGIPVWGMLRFIDRELTDLSTQDLRFATTLRRAQIRRDISSRRRERDVLFTSSQPLELEAKELHALKEHQAFVDSLDPRKRETILLDWLNGENVLENYWQLNIPDERPNVRDRWGVGCWPLLLPVPLLLCCVVPFVPGVEIRHDVCPDGVRPMFQVFDTGSSQEPSIEGSLVARYWQLVQQETLSRYREFDDPQLWDGAQKIRRDNTMQYQAFQNYFMEDALDVKERITRERDGDPFMLADDYGPRFVVATCENFEQHYQQAKSRPVGIPETWRDRLDRFWQHRPRVDFSRFPLIRIAYY